MSIHIHHPFYSNNLDHEETNIHSIILYIIKWYKALVEVAKEAIHKAWVLQKRTNYNLILWQLEYNKDIKESNVSFKDLALQNSSQLQIQHGR